MNKTTKTGFVFCSFIRELESCKHVTMQSEVINPRYKYLFCGHQISTEQRVNRPLKGTNYCFSDVDSRILKALTALHLILTKRTIQETTEWSSENNGSCYISGPICYNEHGQSRQLTVSCNKLGITYIRKERFRKIPEVHLEEACYSMDVCIGHLHQSTLTVWGKYTKRDISWRFK